MSDLLESFESNWTFAHPHEHGLTADSSELAPKIEDDLRTEVAGFRVWMNNYMPDSRGSAVDYGEWRRLLLASNLSEEDRLKRIPMLGEAGGIYPFSSDNGNCGFLALGTGKTSCAWAEVWDSQGVQRVRINFEGNLPIALEVASITRELAELQWPTERDEQASDGDD